MFYSIFTVELYCHHRTTPLRARRFAWVSPLVDGCIPSDMATGKSAQIDEERRLLYVAMTRAKEHLYLIQPLRFFRTQQHRFGDGHAHRSALALFAGRRNDAVTRTVASTALLPVTTRTAGASQHRHRGAVARHVELNASRPRSASRSRIRSSPCRAKISATVAMLPSTPAMPPSAPHRCVTSDSSRLLRSRDGATLRPAIDRDQSADAHEQQHLQRLALRRRLARQVASTHRR